MFLVCLSILVFWLLDVVGCCGYVLWWGSQLRSGNVIAALLPVDRGARRELRVGMVLSVWTSTKKPRLSTSSTPMAHCVAARVLEMQPVLASERTFTCNGISTPWVVMPESVVAILSPESFQDDAQECALTLSQESMDYFAGLK